MTIKIAHIADTHLGYRQYGLMEREKDFYDSFEKIIDDIIEKNVDYVIHSGDLFEQPKPPINALLVAQKGFTKLTEKGVEIFVIAGNHDLLQRKESSIPHELYKNSKFHILSLNKNIYHVNENLVISGLPFIQKSHEEAVKDILSNISEKVKNYKFKILMLHGGTTKHFDFNPEFELDTIPEGFDYYAMGHIHKRILENDFKNGILSYPGSTEIKDKGEINEYNNNGKGYNLLTIDNKIEVEYVNIELERKFIVKSIKYPELDEKVTQIREHIEKNILEKTDKKPVLIITVKEGNFDRSDVSQRVYDKLEDVSLTIRLTYEPTKDVDTPSGTTRHLYAEELIKERVSEKYDETIGNMSVELYHTLSTSNMEKAEEIINEYYYKLYEIEEENDNK